MLTITKEQQQLLNIKNNDYLLDKKTNHFYHILGLEYQIDTIKLLHYKVEFNHSYIPLNEDNDYKIYRTSQYEVELTHKKDIRGVLAKNLDDLAEEYEFEDFEQRKTTKSIAFKMTPRQRYDLDRWCITNQISHNKLLQICMINKDKILRDYKNNELKKLSDKNCLRQTTLPLD